MTATFHQEGSASQSSGAATVSPVVAITIGESCVVMASWDAASTTTPTVTTNGGAGTDTLTLIYGPFTGASPATQAKYAAWLLQSATASRTGVVLTWASSNPAFADASGLSFSGLVSPVLDKTASKSGSTTSITSIATGTLSATDEFACAYATTTSTVTAANAPWTSDGPTPVTGSYIEHQLLTANTSVSSNFTGTGNWATFCLTFMAAQTAVVVLGDYAIDAGLSALDTDCDKVFVCNTAPTSYADATSGANSLGSKNWGAGAAFGAPAARSGGGRQITSVAINDGTISTAGTVVYWAAVDSANSRLLAYGTLTGGAAVTVGQIFTLGAMTFGIPNT